MRLTSTRITTSLVASAALAGGMLAIGAGTTASGQPLTSQSIVRHGSPTTGDNQSSPPCRPGFSPETYASGSCRHGHSAAASGLLPGDVRVWELLHPWRP